MDAGGCQGLASIYTAYCIFHVIHVKNIKWCTFRMQSFYVIMNVVEYVFQYQQTESPNCKIGLIGIGISFTFYI